MEEYYSSEIARLVLGYLDEIECPNTWHTFLKECADLQEYYEFIKKKKKYSTKVGGDSLLDILRAYYQAFKIPKKNAGVNTDEKISTLVNKAIQTEHLSSSYITNFSPLTGQNVSKAVQTEYLSPGLSSSDVKLCDSRPESDFIVNENSANCGITTDKTSNRDDQNESASTSADVLYAISVKTRQNWKVKRSSNSEKNSYIMLDNSSQHQIFKTPIKYKQIRPGDDKSRMQNTELEKNCNYAATSLSSHIISQKMPEFQNYKTPIKENQTKAKGNESPYRKNILLSAQKKYYLSPSSKIGEIQETPLKLDSMARLTLEDVRHSPEYKVILTMFSGDKETQLDFSPETDSSILNATNSTDVFSEDQPPSLSEVKAKRTENIETISVENSHCRMNASNEKIDYAKNVSNSPKNIKDVSFCNLVSDNKRNSHCINMNLDQEINKSKDNDSSSDELSLKSASSSLNVNSSRKVNKVSLSCDKIKVSENISSNVDTACLDDVNDDSASSDSIIIIDEVENEEVTDGQKITFLTENNNSAINHNVSLHENLNFIAENKNQRNDIGPISSQSEFQPSLNLNISTSVQPSNQDCAVQVDNSKNCTASVNDDPEIQPSENHNVTTLVEPSSQISVAEIEISRTGNQLVSNHSEFQSTINRSMTTVTETIQDFAIQTENSKKNNKSVNYHPNPKFQSSMSNNVILPIQSSNQESALLVANSRTDCQFVNNQPQIQSAINSTEVVALQYSSPDSAAQVENSEKDNETIKRHPELLSPNNCNVTQSIQPNNQESALQVAHSRTDCQFVNNQPQIQSAFNSTEVAALQYSSPDSAAQVENSEKGTETVKRQPKLLSHSNCNVTQPIQSNNQEPVVQTENIAINNGLVSNCADIQLPINYCSTTAPLLLNPVQATVNQPIYGQIFNQPLLSIPPVAGVPAVITPSFQTNTMVNNIPYRIIINTTNSWNGSSMDGLYTPIASVPVVTNLNSEDLKNANRSQSENITHTRATLKRKKNHSPSKRDLDSMKPSAKKSKNIYASSVNSPSKQVSILLPAKSPAKSEAKIPSTLPANSPSKRSVSHPSKSPAKKTRNHSSPPTNSSNLKSTSRPSRSPSKGKECTKVKKKNLKKKKLKKKQTKLDKISSTQDKLSPSSEHVSKFSPNKNLICSHLPPTPLKLRKQVEEESNGDVPVFSVPETPSKNNVVLGIANQFNEGFKSPVLKLLMSNAESYLRKNSPPSTPTRKSPRIKESKEENRHSPIAKVPNENIQHAEQKEVSKPISKFPPVINKRKMRIPKKRVKSNELDQSDASMTSVVLDSMEKARQHITYSKFSTSEVCNKKIADSTDIIKIFSPSTLSSNQSTHSKSTINAPESSEIDYDSMVRENMLIILEPSTCKDCEEHQNAIALSEINIDSELSKSSLPKDGKNNILPHNEQELEPKNIDIINHVNSKNNSKYRYNKGTVNRKITDYMDIAKSSLPTSFSSQTSQSESTNDVNKTSEMDDNSMKGNMSIVLESTTCKEQQNSIILNEITDLEANKLPFTDDKKSNILSHSEKEFESESTDVSDDINSEKNSKHRFKKRVVFPNDGGLNSKKELKDNGKNNISPHNKRKLKSQSTVNINDTKSKKISKREHKVRGLVPSCYNYENSAKCSVFSEKIKAYSKQTPNLPIETTCNIPNLVKHQSSKDISDVPSKYSERKHNDASFKVDALIKSNKKISKHCHSSDTSPNSSFVGIANESGEMELPPIHTDSSKSNVKRNLSLIASTKKAVKNSLEMEEPQTNCENNMTCKVNNNSEIFEDMDTSCIDDDWCALRIDLNDSSNSSFSPLQSKKRINGRSILASSSSDTTPSNSPEKEKEINYPLEKVSHLSTVPNNADHISLIEVDNHTSSKSQGLNVKVDNRTINTSIERSNLNFKAMQDSPIRCVSSIRKKAIQHSTLSEEIPAGVKIPSKWNKTKIRTYSHAIRQSPGSSEKRKKQKKAVVMKQKTVTNKRKAFKRIKVKGSEEKQDLQQKPLSENTPEAQVENTSNFVSSDVKLKSLPYISLQKLPLGIVPDVPNDETVQNVPDILPSLPKELLSNKKPPNKKSLYLKKKKQSQNTVAKEVISEEKNYNISNRLSNNAYSKSPVHNVADNCENTRDMVESDIGRSTDEGSELNTALKVCEKLLISPSANYSASPIKSILEQGTLKNNISPVSVHDAEKMARLLSKIKKCGVQYILDRLEES